VHAEVYLLKGVMFETSDKARRWERLGGVDMAVERLLKYVGSDSSGM
jgi:hypothetical protein